MKRTDDPFVLMQFFQYCLDFRCRMGFRNDTEHGIFQVFELPGQGRTSEIISRGVPVPVSFCVFFQQAVFPDLQAACGNQPVLVLRKKRRIEGLGQILKVPIPGQPFQYFPVRNDRIQLIRGGQ